MDKQIRTLIQDAIHKFGPPKDDYGRAAIIEDALIKLRERFGVATESEFLPEPETVDIDGRCHKRGCRGVVEFADDNEIYDGQIGTCPKCGSRHVACELVDGDIVLSLVKKGSVGK